MEQSYFALACEKAGGLVALANSINRPKQTVNHYKTRVPEDACVLIELATGVRCEDLRPDLYWIRVEDDDWPNGKPCIDMTRSKAVEAATAATPRKPSEHASAKRGSDRPSNFRD